MAARGRVEWVFDLELELSGPGLLLGLALSLRTLKHPLPDRFEQDSRVPAQEVEKGLLIGIERFSPGRLAGECCPEPSVCPRVRECWPTR